VRLSDPPRVLPRTGHNSLYGRRPIASTEIAQTFGWSETRRPIHVRLRGAHNGRVSRQTDRSPTRWACSSERDCSVRTTADDVSGVSIVASDGHGRSRARFLDRAYAAGVERLRRERAGSLFEGRSLPNACGLRPDPSLPALLCLA
jgi:hypothetical protein